MHIKEPLTPVVLAFTFNYLVPAATCILSMLKHSAEKEGFHVICLLNGPLPEEIKLQLNRLDRERLRFTFLDLRGKFAGNYVDEKYTEAASYRLLLPELLPEYEKVIYVDCDVVIRNNLARLYREVDLKDNYLAGVFEAPLDFQLSHIQALGCAPGSYVNSGFLVMNLALLRQDGMTRKFLAESKKEDYLFPDQDILNKLCKGRILGLPPIYNSLRTFFLPQYKADFLKYYSAEDWEAVQRHGNVHYTGAKPWDTFTIKFSIWWRYYESLPAELKEKGRVNRKMQYMHKIFSTQWGSLALEGVQNVYRRLKYRTA